MTPSMTSQSLLPELSIADVGESPFSQMLASFGSSSSPDRDNDPPPPDEHPNSNPSPNPNGADPSSSSSSLLSPNSGVRRLPIPTPSANHSRASITFIDAEDDSPNAEFEGLSPEVLAADISIAPDGSFVETSSGSAAHELKKRYDRMMGISMHNPSPFALTAFTNQHGRQMFRVGHRDSNPLGRTAEQVQEEMERRATMHVGGYGYGYGSQRSVMGGGVDARRATHSVSDRRSPRRSRLSINAFFPPAAAAVSTAPPKPTPAPPPDRAAISRDGARSPTTRRLRRTRSNPQLSMQSQTRAQEPTAQPPHTGRGHSQSVTAADMPRYSNSSAVVPAEPAKPAPRLDLFSEMMQWQDVGPSSPTTASGSQHSAAASTYANRSRSASASRDGSEPGAVIPNPFGARVVFDSPSRPSTGHLHAPVIREMQSFESGLTARADPTPRGSQRTTMLSQASFSPGDDASPTQPDDTLPPSAPSTPSVPAAPFTPRPTSVDRGYTPTMETLMYTQYSTEVFDVLQTYRGLPLLEKLLPDSTETTVIKMSLTADERATPRDDPRFVIWGEVLLDPEPSGARADRSHTPSSSSRSGRRSTKGSDDRPVLAESSADTIVDGAAREKLLLAATIERWIAQLTSELNYDELLVFFMTYRTYIRPVDLCHLLICRFHWALGQHTSEHDEMVRRIVRVRTFVAMRYWLLTFFEVDFIPNRELRLLIAGWLNALKKDPILQKHHDASGIVRKLVSVVRECKEVHSQRVRPMGPRTTPSSSPPSTSPPKKHPLVALFGKSFEGIPANNWTWNDSDIDLDFVPEGQFGDGDSAGGSAEAVSGGDSVLQQPLHRAIMEHRPSISATPNPLPITPATLPVHQNVLSRAFVNTIGRLGRWKRVNSRPAAFNSRHAGSTPLTVCGDVSAFDLELNVTDDLLTVRGGVEQYLKLIEMDAHVGASNPTSPTSIPGVIAPPPPVPPRAEPIPPDSPTGSITPAVASDDVPTAVPAVEEAEVTMPRSPTSAGSQAVHVSLDSGFRPASVASSSRTGSSGSSVDYGQVIRSRFPGSGSSRHNPWGVDVISIDDLDLSDDSGGEEEPDLSAPPGLGRAPRRLPLRRDFEFVGRNRQSVSSMGLTSARSSVASSRASDGPLSVGLGTTIQQWQVDALVDSLSDDEESGDVEDALRRLEGNLNPQRQREKTSKVDNWVKTIRERLEAGDYGLPTDMPRDSTEAGEGDHRMSLVWSIHTADAAAGVNGGGSAQSSPRSARRVIPPSADANDPSTPVITQAPHTVPLPPGSPEIDPAVPEEILRSRVTASNSPLPLSPQSSLRSAANSTVGLGQQPSKFASSSPLPQVHRSWVLSHGSAELAEHFSMIDKELFLEIKFEELIGDDWIRAVEETRVLNWGTYLKDRARWKAERRGGYKTSGLTTIRARFNLVACFVQSEIVLTPPASRPMLVGKFIRMAWKCYSLNNYSTLVAIITGLRSEWVNRAMRGLWNRVNVYNLRMLKDLTSFVSREDDFLHIQIAVRALEEAKAGGNDEAGSSKGSSAKGGKDVTQPSGVPFVGIYLSQLQRYAQLPDLIDPTAPDEAVGIDRSTNNFQTPAHPEVFATLAPLPPSMQLEPLINVHKQRLIAGTIKSLVAGQHLASRVSHPIDKQLFQRCLKLRGLDPETLQRAQAMYPYS